MEEEQRDVATFNTGDVAVNTLKVALRDVIVPIEMDLEDDALQDDEVRLTSLGGAMERVLSRNSPDVEADRQERRLYFRFRAVPLGAYRVCVRIAGEWTAVFRDLVVRGEGAFSGGMRLDTQRPRTELAPPVEVAAEPVNSENDEDLWVEQIELAEEP
ncbi:hypothetical protein JGU66_07585 [Myxococcaceae bacterium JPH2]|nr:hypothetical protein [Myxococcaceae bacterium JPH2]